MQPFVIAVPDARLAVIHDKLASYDWDQLPDTGGWRSGVGKADLRRLVDYWLDTFNWRATERRLNTLPHMIADVDGEPIHFIHAHGNGSKPPLLLLHGWPGSFIEFEALIAPLTADGHDVVVPSLPGFGFSTPITDIFGPRRAGGLLHALMERLFGETRYIIQGGDWGAHIASWMAHDRPHALRGFHVNMVSIFAEGTKPSTPEERALTERRNAILKRVSPHRHWRPQPPVRVWRHPPSVPARSGSRCRVDREVSWKRRSRGWCLPVNIRRTMRDRSNVTPRVGFWVADAH